MRVWTAVCLYALCRLLVKCGTLGFVDSPLHAGMCMRDTLHLYLHGALRITRACEVLEGKARQARNTPGVCP